MPLLYHPFYDARHCVFRILRLLEEVGHVEVEMQRLRIWDFYLLFPTALLQTRFPRGSVGLRRKIQNLQTSYDILPDPKRAFARLEVVQSAALGHLSSLGLIRADLLRADKVQRTEARIPQDLQSQIKKRNGEDILIISFLTTVYLDLELYGTTGLRQRTDLFDYRYDVS